MASSLVDRPTPSLGTVFRERGFLTLPKLIDDGHVEALVTQLERRSRRWRGTAHGTAHGATHGTANGDGHAWALPDGVTKHDEFWSVIFDASLLAAVRALIGDDARYLQHTDLHVGFPSCRWHRDSVCHALGVGPDWDEHDAPYRLVRVAIYLHGAAGHFKLGLVPGSHRLADPRATRARLAIERSASWIGHVRRFVTGHVPDVPDAEWVAASPGDVVLFDPRVLHTGTPVDGPAYSLFLAFGVPNRHFAHHARHYRHERTDLGYGPMRPMLVERLQAAGLYAPVDDAPVPEAAPQPTLVERLVTSRLRAR